MPGNCASHGSREPEAGRLGAGGRKIENRGRKLGVGSRKLRTEDRNEVEANLHSPASTTDGSWKPKTKDQKAKDHIKERAS